MAESMQGLHRTCRCAEVTKEMIGKEVVLMGWVQKARDKGGIIFVDLRDRSGIVQLIFENGSIVLYTDESPREDLDREIFADIQLKKYPVREFNSVINDLTNVIGTYEKLNHRNHKKDDEHLNKHAMHLIRLYLLCLDILEKEDIVTYRGDDLPLLMSIRKGDYQLEDGTYRPEFFEMVSDFEKRLNYAKQNTSLPDNPDMKKVEEFVMSVNRRAIDA
mgnify:CR=1 FL=1